MLNFPKIVHVLDIETEKIKKTKDEIKQTHLFENTPNIYFAGLKTYKFVKGKYYSVNYKCFLPEKFKDLQSFLERRSGLIIGHNLFDFDYKVLSKHISLSSIVEKSLDTLYFLYKKKGEKFGGISLNDLAKVNLNKQKTFDGGRVEKEWKKGNHKKVIKYNENDCKLTFELYKQMIFKGYVYYKSFSENVKLEITKKDLGFLTGEKKMISRSKWKSLLSNGSKLMIKTTKTRLSDSPDDEEFWEPDPPLLPSSDLDNLF